MRNNSTKSLIRKKLVLALFMTASLVSFASLGDGGAKKAIPAANSTTAARLSAKNFSLRSGYNYKGNTLLNSTPRKNLMIITAPTTYEINMNKVVIQTKKRVMILDKVKFVPAPRM